jgi:hypothetical protein
LFVSPPPVLSQCGIAAILESLQDLRFHGLGSGVLLCILDGGIGGILLGLKLPSLSLQVIPFLADLSQPCRVQPSGLTELPLVVSQARDHRVDARGRFANCRGGLQALGEGSQRGVSAILANALQRGQPS